MPTTLCHLLLRAISMVDKIFEWVARWLICLARRIGWSYNEVNIVVYYALIPFTWAIMIDQLCKFHYIKIGYAVFIGIVLLVCGDFHSFCDRLFDLSARFLCSFRWCGLNYIAASVVLCVILPIVIYAFLGYLLWVAQD